MLSFISLISSNKSLNIELENIPNIKKQKFKIEITWISDLRFYKEKMERKLGQKQTFGKKNKFNQIFTKFEAKSAQPSVAASLEYA